MSSDKLRKSLTPRQAVFVSEYLKHSNGAAAAVAAGYSMNTARHRAWDLLRNCRAVRQAVQAARSAMAAKTEYNVEKAMEEAEKAIQFAIKTKNANAYVKAVELRAKLMGLMVDKFDIRQAVGFKVEISGIRDDRSKPVTIDSESVSEKTGGGGGAPPKSQ